MVLDHEIFDKPFNVDIKYDTFPAPNEYGNNGIKPGTPVKVWNVQTKGFSTDKSMRPGLVSMGARFADSPDAEFISSGINHKMPMRWRSAVTGTSSTGDSARHQKT